MIEGKYEAREDCEMSNKAVYNIWDNFLHLRYNSPGDTPHGENHWACSVKEPATRCEGCVCSRDQVQEWRVDLITQDPLGLPSQETESSHTGAEHLIVISFDSPSRAVPTGRELMRLREKLMHMSRDLFDKC